MTNTIEALLFAMGANTKLKISREPAMEMDPQIKQIGICVDGRVGYDAKTDEYILQTLDCKTTYRVNWPEM